MSEQEHEELAERFRYMAEMEGHGDGFYAVRIPNLWANLEGDVIVYPDKDLTPIK